MKKLPLLLVMILSLSIIAPTCFAESSFSSYTNLLNSYYECDRKMTTYSKHTVSVDDDAYSGNSSLLITGSEGNAVYKHQSLAQTVFSADISNHNDTYYYSFWLKLSEASVKNVSIFVPYYYKKKNDTTNHWGGTVHYGGVSVKQTTDWQYVSGSFKMDFSTAINNNATAIVSPSFVLAIGSFNDATVSNYPLSLNIDLLSLTNASSNQITTTHINTSDVIASAGNREIEFSLNTQYVDTYSATNAYVTLNGTNLPEDSYTLSAERNISANSSSVKLTLTNADVSLEGKTVEVCGITDLWGRAIDISVSYDKTYQDVPYSEPIVLLEEKFRGTYIPAGQQHTHASGWRTNCNGGNIEGRNSYLGFYINDTSATEEFSVEKVLRTQSDGVLIFEGAVTLPDVTGEFNLHLGGSKDVFLLKFSQGSLYYIAENIDYKVCDYTIDKRIGFKAKIDLVNSIADIYINGQLMGYQLPLKDSSPVERIKISCGLEQTGSIKVHSLTLYKGYILHEEFIPYNADNLVFGEYDSNGVALINNLHYDPYGLILTSAGSYFAKNLNVNDNADLEFKFIATEKLNAPLITVSGTNGKIASLSADTNGKLSLDDGTVLCDYVSNVWYNVKLKLNVENNTFDVYVNRRKIKENIAFVNENTSISSLKFENNSGIALQIDDIYMYLDTDIPQDYVPVPTKAESSDYYLSMLACNLWREGSNRGWDAISSFPERTPIMGFYDEGNPEVSDWETKWLVEHGIDCEIFCWYAPTNPVPLKNPGNGIEAYMNSKYSNMMDYAIMWTNTGRTYDSAEFRNYIVPMWVENFFKDDRYCVVDNEPVVYVFSASALIEGFGSVDNLAAEIAYLEQECKKLGFDGVKFFMYTLRGREGEYAQCLNKGVDGFFNYGYDYVNNATVKSLYKTANYSNHIPLISVNPNNEAWSAIPENYTEPTELKELAQWFKTEIIPDSKFTDETNNKKLVMVNNWNEFGEGHFMMPTEKLGFSYLDAIREVFVGGTHTDTVPTQSQKDRITYLFTQDASYDEPTLFPELPIENDTVKIWNFDSNEEFPDLNGNVDLRIEDGKLKGYVINDDPYFWWSGLNLDISDSSSVIIGLTTSGVGGQVFFDSNGTSDNAVNFYSENVSGIQNEYVIDMRYNANWNGNLTRLRIDPPCPVGGSFEIDYIKITKSNEYFSNKDILALNGFESETPEIVCNGASSQIQHKAFNNGVSSLKVNKSADSETVKIPITNFYGPQKIYAFAQAKLVEGTDNANLQMYITYQIGNENYRLDLSSKTISSEGWIKLVGDAEVVHDDKISNAYLCFTSDSPVGSTYYIDDVVLSSSSVEVSGARLVLEDEVVVELEFPLDVDSIFNEALAIDLSGDRILSVHAENVIDDYECTNSGYTSGLDLSLVEAGYGGNNSAVQVKTATGKPVAKYTDLLVKTYKSNTSFPVENGKTYHYGFWIKTSNTALTKLALYAPYYYISGASGSQAWDSVPLVQNIPLKATDEWQYVSGEFVANLEKYTDDAGSKPLQWSFKIAAWEAGEGADDMTILFDKVHVSPDDINSFYATASSAFDIGESHKIKLSGIKTASGTEVPTFAVDFDYIVDLSASDIKYYADYGTTSQKEVQFEHISGPITLSVDLTNEASAVYKGELIASVYSGNVLKEIYNQPISIKGNSAQTVTTAMNVSEVDKIKIMVWDAVHKLIPRISSIEFKK